MGCLLSAALREARRRSLRVTGILRAGLRRLAWRLSRSAFRSGAWTVELSNGTRVELGRDKEREGGSNAGALAARGDGLEQRCRRLAAAWKAVTAQWGEEIQRV